jgi:REP element-mobilizing transposase RayT
MSRPLRVIKQNVTYHCHSRCLEKRDLLYPDSVKDIALRAVRRAKRHYNFNLSYIEFVGNHIHIVIKTVSRGATISRIIQYIKARISEYYNQMLGRTGPFWNERFKSEIIEDYKNPQQNFLKLIWYLSYNPIRKGVFYNPRENIYSGIQTYLSSKRGVPIPIQKHEYFMSLGTSFFTRNAEFLKFEEDYLRIIASGDKDDKK